MQDRTMPKNKRSQEKDEVLFSINNDNRGDWRSFAESPKAKENKEDTPKDEGKRRRKKQKIERNIGSEPGEKDAVGLRVIGGKFRGSKLQYVGDNRVRPMKDRVREAVFNLIGPGIKGMYVIDLFGGTGAVTIEALSRGAVGATVVELHLPTAALLRKNLESLNLLEICKLRKTDAFFWAKNVEEHPRDTPPWIVFCCPPYGFYIDRQAEILDMLRNLLDSAPAESMFVIESDERFDFNLLPIVPPENRLRSYPPAEVGIFVKPGGNTHGAGIPELS